LSLDSVAAVWETLLSDDAEWLAEKILHFQLTEQNVRHLFAEEITSKRETAFQVLVRNRISHGGILASGAGVLKNGENGRGLRSRWYPQTLARRIRDLQQVRATIKFTQGDAFDIIRGFSEADDVCFFIDPPYSAGGKRAGSRLYTHSEINHQEPFSLCQNLKSPFLMSYDNCSHVRELAIEHGFQTTAIPMKNTHHAEMTELLITAPNNISFQK
jgi:DNA adenine methylase